MGGRSFFGAAPCCRAEPMLGSSKKQPSMGSALQKAMPGAGKPMHDDANCNVVKNYLHLRPTQ
ncbi:protein of unknown function [Stenotrophomonas maltophilia]|nr:protein of unknown function [Stenotrophomonas maltophilia]